MQAHLDLLAGKTTVVKVAAKDGWREVATLPKGTYKVTTAGTWGINAKNTSVTADGGKELLDGIPIAKLVARSARR